jgi:uncharacterized membrane protein YhdT
MKVHKIKMGCTPDSSGGFGFILMYPLACIVAAILASGCIYAAVQLGVLDDEEEAGERDEESEESKD